jgi:uncharacterized membrane protein
MRSLLYAIIIGLLGAAALHIVVILTIPVYSGLDAYARVLDLGADGEFKQLPENASENGLAVSGPFRKEAVCAFSFDDGPVLLTTEGKVPLWSATVYNSSSSEIFSMNDHASINGNLDIIAGTEAQIAELKKAASSNIANAILVSMPSGEGYVVVRAISPDKTMDAAAVDFLDAASCDPLSDQ